MTNEERPGVVLFEAVRPDEYRGEVTRFNNDDAEAAWVRVRPIVSVLHKRARDQAEEQLMIEGYREMGDEMLEITQGARAAQLRAYRSE